MADPRRVALWLSMAEHFLDTETRHQLPVTALRCVEAGLGVDAGREVWRNEVAPAVGANLLSVAGEWAGWDRDWLVARITERRVLRQGFGSLGRRVEGWIGSRLGAGYWKSIERCLGLLLAAPAEAREQLAADLAFLARHYFDFCPPGFADLSAPAQERIRALYPEPFCHALAPALESKEAKEADRRVRTALKA